MKLARVTTHTLTMTDEEFAILVKLCALIRCNYANFHVHQSHRAIADEIIDLSQGWVEGVER